MSTSQVPVIGSGVASSCACTTGRLAAGSGSRVAAAGADGLIHVLDRRSLEPLGLFSADASIQMRGTCAGSFAVFSAAKGKVVGVLLDR
ncbi:MAG: hypothetical protein HUU36_10095 [Candidatus Omnitrophica bacterium]|nr:hypothetical protein [Candidatus Omnitrophota bacterium]